VRAAELQIKQHVEEELLQDEIIPMRNRSRLQTSGGCSVLAPSTSLVVSLRPLTTEPVIYSLSVAPETQTLFKENRQIQLQSAVAALDTARCH
jgi:hypothetical protein